MRLVRGTQPEVVRLFFISENLDGSHFRELARLSFLKGSAYAASFIGQRCYCVLARHQRQREEHELTEPTAGALSIGQIGFPPG